MKFTAATIFGLVAVVTATDCTTADNQCRGSGDPNEAVCSANLAQCQGDCLEAYDACRVTPNANMAYCASNYASCLGMNPFTGNGTLTVTPKVDPAVSATVTSSATSATSTGECYTAYRTCQSSGDPNEAECAAEYAGCLGYNPFASNGTLTATPGADSDVVYTTEVTTSFTTYCPAATTLTFNQKTYTVSSATTLTITDCPCTLTHSTSAAPTPTSIPGGCNPAHPGSCPPTYFNTTTGGAVPTTKPTLLGTGATTTTALVTAYTTYCPSPTTVTIGTSTYTVSSATTITYTASSAFPVTQIKSAFTSVVTPAAGTGTVASNSTVTTSATPSVFTGAAAAAPRWTVGGSSALLAVALALLF